VFVCHDQRTGTGCGAVNQDNAQFCKQCGRPLRFAVQLHNPGEVIGAYRIVRVIGHGGFGAVYEAQETAPSGRTVALKETFDPDQIQSYQAEFAVLARLQHPHLPRYDTVFTAGGNGYLVMEMVPGQSLEEVLKKQGGPLLEAQVLGYALQLCDALAYLHRQTPTILHRDIKPANVRLTPEGLIKLVDFGLVKEGGGTTRHSRRAVTPPYAPPEQWGIGGQHTDPRSDLYALGATLYHLLTGLEPPPATDRISVTPDPLLTPQSVNPTISPAVADAIVQSMALAVNQRPADAAALRRLLVGGGRTARPGAAPTRTPTSRPLMPPVTPVPAALPAPPAPARRTHGALAWMAGLGIFVVLATWAALAFGLVGDNGSVAPTAIAVATHTPLPTWTPTALPADTATATAPTAPPSPTATPIPPTETAPPGPLPTSTPLGAATVTPLPAPAELTVNAENVNIRSGPGTDYGLIGTANLGQRFPITGRNSAGDWWEIDYNGQPGWVFGELANVRNAGEVAAVAAPAASTPTAAASPLTASATKVNPVDGAVYVYIPSINGQEGFWIGQTEVTNAQYARCVEAGVCGRPNTYHELILDSTTANYPMDWIYEGPARRYAEWVGGSLPTESQWETACRGTDARKYPWGNSEPTSSLANFGNDDGGTKQIGSYPGGASPFGVLDMAGNAYEYVIKDSNPNAIVFRGGAYHSSSDQIRCTSWVGYVDNSLYRTYGFRVVLPGP
jgi:SH3-like domain-containing protein